MRARASIFLPALGLAAGAALAAPAPAEKGPAAVARVNGAPILRRDFDLAVQIQFQGRPGAVGLDQLKAARERILERLIDSELIHQRAVKAPGVAVSQAEVDAEAKRMRGAYASPEAFAGMLRDLGIRESDFLDQIRRSLLVTRYVEREVVGTIDIGDDEVRRYYDQNPTEMERPERVRLHQIVVRAPADAPAARAAARRKIEAILKELRGGGDFAELARRHSEGPGADRGGDVGVLPRGSGPPPVEAAAFALQPGEISDIVETRIGFHILKAGERTPAGAAPYDDVKQALRARLAARERETRIQRFVDALRGKARIERLGA